MLALKSAGTVLYKAGLFKSTIWKTLQSNAPINVSPPLPGSKLGFTGGIDTKLLPHYGAFDDRSLSDQIFFLL